MNFAILAAGEGSRLRQGGIDTPKPLVDVGGHPLICHMLDAMARSGASLVTVATRSPLNLDGYAGLHVREIIIASDTPAESLMTLLQTIPGGPAVIVTADAVMNPQKFADYVRRFSTMPCGHCLMGVTSHKDDEKPLYVECFSKSSRVKAFADTAPEGTFVSAGVYGLWQPGVASILAKCLAAGHSRLRHFQRALLQADPAIDVFDLGKVIDVDRPEDIAAAEELLKSYE